MQAVMQLKLRFNYLCGLLNQSHNLYDFYKINHLVGNKNIYGIVAIAMNIATFNFNILSSICFF